MNNASTTTRVSILTGLLVLGATAFAAEPRPVPRGLSAALDFAGLPYFKTGTQTYQVSSTDPAEDQFEDYGHWLRTGRDGGAVLADIHGPGTLHRIWSTGNTGDVDRIQIYLDGHEKPDIDETLNQFHGHPPLRDRPQVGSGGDVYLAWWSYLPIPFEKSCKVVRMGNTRPFHSLTYHTYTTSAGITSWNGREDVTKLEDMWSHPERDPKPTGGNVTSRKQLTLQPGESAVIFEHQGAGHIASLRIAHYLPEKGLRLRIFWDGQPVPAVDAPLKWFFGSVDNGGDVRALGVGTVANSGYCYFPMPFWKGARIELVNQSDRATDAMDTEVGFNPRVYEEQAAGYFRAHASETLRPGDRYTCLQVRGRGHVIGMAKRMPAGGHACEADEIFYIDDRKYPDIYGTGEEDYNNCAWWTNSYNSYPTHGCIGNDCYYRLHFPDVLVFEQAIDMEFESWQDYYVASLVWYYANDRPGLVRTDSVDIGKAVSETEHRYRITGEKWSGNEFGRRYPGRRVSTNSFDDDGRSFDGASEFTVRVDPRNQGVRLRVRTNHTSFQRVNVWVDGVRVTERLWSISQNHFDAFWVDSDFEIPPGYTRGKDTITVRLEHVPSYPNWFEYRYDIFSYLP